MTQKEIDLLSKAKTLIGNKIRIWNKTDSSTTFSDYTFDRISETTTIQETNNIVDPPPILGVLISPNGEEMTLPIKTIIEKIG